MDAVAATGTACAAITSAVELSNGADTAVDAIGACATTTSALEVSANTPNTVNATIANDAVISTPKVPTDTAPAVDAGAACANVTPALEESNDAVTAVNAAAGAPVISDFEVPTDASNAVTSTFEAFTNTGRPTDVVAFVSTGVATTLE